MFSSIRHGLFAVLAGFTVLVCICYTGLALVIAYVTEDMVVDRLMQREAAAVAARRTAHGDAAPSGDGLVRAYRAIASLPSPVRERAAAGLLRGEVFTDTGRHYHLRTLELGPGTGADVGAGLGAQRVYLVADVGAILVVSKLVRDVGGMMAAVALGLTGLALLLAWLLSRRLVAPLMALAEEVRTLAPGGPVDFSARRRRDEIGYLADRLGTTIAALQAALAREHAFTRDVSHELRTPLTVMNNALGQAGARPLARHEAAQLRTGLDDIRNTIDVLFALARAEHIAQERIDLRGCIEDSLLRLLDGVDWDDDRLALDVPDRLDAMGNPRLALLLIHNCLGNALFHGGPGARLRLSFADGVLSIANSIDPARAGTMQGFLHGQNLLLRVAAAMRWEVAFHAGAAAYRVDIVPLGARPVGAAGALETR